jgi:hypothetical protein
MLIIILDVGLDLGFGLCLGQFGQDCGLILALCLCPCLCLGLGLCLGISLSLSLMVIYDIKSIL